jgi:hypothetical protein
MDRKNYVLCSALVQKRNVCAVAMLLEEKGCTMIFGKTIPYYFSANLRCTNTFFKIFDYIKSHQLLVVQLWHM